MGFFGKGKKAQEAKSAVAPLEKPEVKAGVDMTEIMSAAARLKGHKPPSGPVIVPASTFPVSAQVKKKQAEAAAVAAAVAEKEAHPEAGQLTKQGIYIGRFKSVWGGEKDWFAAPKDARDSKGNRLLLDFKEAAKYAKDSKALGHSDWILPPGWNDRDSKPDILGAMFNSKSAGSFKDTFEGTGSYWSSSITNLIGDYRRVQQFSDGSQSKIFKRNRLSVRLVRSVSIT